MSDTINTCAPKNTVHEADTPLTDAKAWSPLVNHKAETFEPWYKSDGNAVWADFARQLERNLATAQRELDEARRIERGIFNNIKCGACAEGICCGSIMNAHDPDCVYTQLSLATKLIGELDSAVRLAMDMFAANEISLPHTWEVLLNARTRARTFTDKHAITEGGE